MKPPKRELLCQSCDREYAVWFAPNELWNAVTQQEISFLCPTCFTNLAELKGIEPTAWKLSIEDIDHPRNTDALKKMELLSKDLNVKAKPTAETI